MKSAKKVRPRSADEIEEAAQSLIARFQADALSLVSSCDVVGFFEFELEEDTGISPVYESLPDGLDGFSDCTSMRCCIADRLAERDETTVAGRRLRSTIAHEIGHCYLHLVDARRNRLFQKVFRNNSEGETSLDKYPPEKIKVYEDAEWQAWRFAGALLMPRRTFLHAVDCDWTKRQIQNAFGVNPSFVDVRCRELRVSKLLRRG